MKLLKTKDEETKEEYKRMNREVKQQVVKKKNNPWEKRCECIDNQPVSYTHLDVYKRQVVRNIITKYKT